MTDLELHITAVAAGGEAIARDEGGRVVFVRGALVGERVTARLTEEKASFARATVVDVLEPAPGRREPPCPEVHNGCGGCDWQHATPGTQAEMRRIVVADALFRIGKVVDPVVEVGPELPTSGYRTTLRMAVRNGRAGFRHHHSHDVLAVEECTIAHPLLEELAVEGRFGDASEVTLRVGARTGERLVLTHPHITGVDVPEGVLVVGSNQLRRGRRAWYHEQVAGRTWRISATSFFQCRPDGAEVLIEQVQQMIAAHDTDPDGTLVDLCAGVGLFAGTVAQGRPVVAVERHRPAVADATHNLADQSVRFVRATMEGWNPSPASVVVADPARTGLGAKGVAAAAGTGAGLVVLVSCDPASLGRDAGLLGEAGYRHAGSVTVDLFGETHHTEAVSAFVR